MVTIVKGCRMSPTEVCIGYGNRVQIRARDDRDWQKRQSETGTTRWTNPTLPCGIEGALGTYYCMECALAEGLVW